ncbi:MAG: Uma2 family endonuclease [Candidatus Kapabacteria bacterium]|jgi:hypothetical protein|nr:Uma2 family endonuclease [Candidatus Kapabacteria bacterium]
MSLRPEIIAQTVDDHAVDEYQDLWDELEALTNQLETEDDEPVDSIISERQQRLLVDALYASWQASEPFVALANVGLFYSIQSPAIVPDMLLSLGVEPHPDLRDYGNKLYRSYMMWKYGKPPEVVLEIVSNLKGNELGSKLTQYADIGIEYYVVYDPLEMYGQPALRVFLRRGRQYEQIDEAVFPDIGLRLGMWSAARIKALKGIGCAGLRLMVHCFWSAKNSALCSNKNGNVQNKNGNALNGSAAVQTRQKHVLKFLQQNSVLWGLNRIEFNAKKNQHC